MGEHTSIPVLRCHTCRSEFPIESMTWKCHCGGVIDVRGTPLFSRDQLSQRPMNFWRYRESFALSGAPHISLGEVMTPIHNTRFRDWDVSVKLEFVLPTGSYKDRGVAVCMSHLSALGIRVIAEDSSGNAGASTAAYSAAAGLRANIYVPESTSPAKLNQIGIYGAQYELVPGTRVESARRAQEGQNGAHYMGHSWNPFFACGIKSVAYEIAEQSEWSPPDWIVTPLGGGSLVMGLIDGFEELFCAGYIKSLPRILAVQSASCAPIYEAWIRRNTKVTSVRPRQTVAEGVALPSPARGNQVLEAIYRRAGVIVAVDDEEVISCWQDMAHVGVLMETTSAVAVAGAWRARQLEHIVGQDTVVILITGHGLKTASKSPRSSKI